MKTDKIVYVRQLKYVDYETFKRGQCRKTYYIGTVIVITMMNDDDTGTFIQAKIKWGNSSSEIYSKEFTNTKEGYIEACAYIQDKFFNMIAKLAEGNV